MESENSGEEGSLEEQCLRVGGEDRMEYPEEGSAQPEQEGGLHEPDTGGWVDMAVRDLEVLFRLFSFALSFKK